MTKFMDQVRRLYKKRTPGEPYVRRSKKGEFITETLGIKTMDGWTIDLAKRTYSPHKTNYDFKLYALAIPMAAALLRVEEVLEKERKEISMGTAILIAEIKQAIEGNGHE